MRRVTEKLMMSAVVLGVAAELWAICCSVTSTFWAAASLAAFASTGSERANAAWPARKRSSALEPDAPPPEEPPLTLGGGR